MSKSERRRTYRSPLREEQAENTRGRIIDAMASLAEENDFPDISTAAIAQRAGVSQPTVFHYFPTKGALFRALADRQFRYVVEGLAPRTPEELVEAIRTVYRRSHRIEPLVRWTLANPIASSTPRPHRSDRMRLLQTALKETLDGLPDEEAQRLERVALLLSSPTASLYWQDYLGLSPDESADVAGWALLALVAHLRESD